LEPKGLKIGKVGLKPPPKEHENKVYNVKIGELGGIVEVG
jgi:hypothetical protein